MAPRLGVFSESMRPRLARAAPVPPQGTCWKCAGSRAGAVGVSLAARLVAQRPDRDIGTHFEGIESLVLWVAVDAGVLPAVA